MNTNEINISNIVQLPNGQYIYVMDWSDCPNKFIYKHIDWYKVAEVKDTLESRMDKFLSGKSRNFTTSDIEGLQYKKRKV